MTPRAYTLPDLSRLSGQQAFRVISLGGQQVRLDASQIDPVTQQIASRHIVLSE